MTSETKLNDGGPAFPLSKELAINPVTDIHGRDVSSGMSLRDWFAGQALVGMTASPALMEVVTSGSILDGSSFDRLAMRAYQMADALLSAREVKNGK